MEVSTPKKGQLGMIGAVMLFLGGDLAVRLRCYTRVEGATPALAIHYAIRRRKEIPRAPWPPICLLHYLDDSEVT